jgi:hypothetical protein
MLLNVLLIGISLASVAYIAREVRPRTPSSATPLGRVGQPPVSATVPTTAASPSAGHRSVVASRNLFSPTRTEVTLALTGRPGSAPAPAPNLYGVVLGDGAPIAYLEDPATKRVADYRTGDTVAGSTVKLITADRVILARPEGPVEVRLNDPAKPRPEATPPPPASGQISLPPGGVPQPGMPRLQERRRPREE